MKGVEFKEIGATIQVDRIAELLRTTSGSDDKHLRRRRSMLYAGRALVLSVPAFLARTTGRSPNS